MGLWGDMKNDKDLSLSRRVGGCFKSDEDEREGEKNFFKKGIIFQIFTEDTSLRTTRHPRRKVKLARSLELRIRLG